MKLDLDRLSRLADNDPHMDREFFDSFIKEKWNKKTSRQPSADDFEFDSGDYQIKGATSRPGLGSSRLKRESLRNKPTEDGDYEVRRADAIPLKTYKKMAVDPEIAFGIFLLKGWIGGLPYEIKCHDEQIKEITTHILKDHWDDLVRNMMDAAETGFAFGEKVWERKDIHIQKEGDSGGLETIYEGKVAGLEKVKFLDPEHSFVYYKKNDELVRVEQYQLRKIASVSRDKLVWFALDKKYSSIFGKSRLKNAYTSWYYGEVVDKYMLNDLQKRGSPHLEIRYPQGNSIMDGERVPNNVIAEIIANKMMADGIAILPSESDENGNRKWEITYADTKQQSSKSPFLEVIDKLGNRKLKGMGIPPSVADSDSNFSSADAGGDLLLVVVEDIVKQLESAIKKELVDYIVEYNFGPKAKSLVDLEIDKSALGRRNLMKEIFKTMLRTGTSMKGHTLKAWPDPASMMRELGVSTKSFGEVFLEMADGSTDRPSGESLVDEVEKDEDSNDTDAHRGEPDNRDRGRATGNDSVTEST